VERQIEETADRWIAVQEESSGRQHSSKDSVRFLFVGRLVYYKGCNELIRAFIQASASRSDLFLDIVGTGPLEREMKEMVHEAGLEERVRFYANVEDEELAEFFGTCDVFVLPSVARSEAFGLVQIEAMAFGKPVINTKLPSGVPYVSLDQVTGLTVPPEDVHKLAQAMQYLAEHPDERREMGVRARQRMKKMYRIDTMLEHVKKLYEELMEGNE
jgi:rhamnosyl/mannosyltransferase